MKLVNLVEDVGEKMLRLIATIGGMTVLLIKAFGCIVRPMSRHHRLSIHLNRIGTDTLPVSGLIIFLISMVIALQTAYQLRALGGQELIPGLVAITMTRELAPVLTAVVLAGRAGAAITAEIGTMVVTEQVDAMRVMGADPVKVLVAPRMIALCIMAPLLTIYADVIGLCGGYAVSATKLGLSPVFYVNAVFESLQISDVMTGLIKAFVFGAVVCMVACFEGLRVKGGAEGVGQATRRSVVFSFILIVAADFFFTFIFYHLLV